MSKSLMQDENDMEPISCLTDKCNTADRSVDPGKVSPLNRIAFATGLAQAAFGRFYSPPEHEGFRDREPHEVRR